MNDYSFIRVLQIRETAIENELETHRGFEKDYLIRRFSKI
jgi:hypothetical protein